MTDSPDTLEHIVLQALENLKATQIKILDVHDQTAVTDKLIIANGNSTRHVVSIAEEVVETCKKAGFRPLGMEGENEGDWVLVDLGEIVVHVMLPATREYYDLERLWSIKPSERQKSED